MKKKLILGITLLVFAMFVTFIATNVYADAITINVNPSNFAEKLKEAKGGETFILSGGEYSGEYVIDKDVTIKGDYGQKPFSNTKFSGKMRIAEGAKNVTIEGIQFGIYMVNKSRILFDVQTPVNLTLKNFTSYTLTREYAKLDIVCVNVNENAGGSTINMDNFYGESFYDVIRVQSGNNVININDSYLSGQVCLDIDAAKSSSKASNNKITVTNTEIKGRAWSRSSDGSAEDVEGRTDGRDDEIISYRNQSGLEMIFENCNISDVDTIFSNLPTHLLDFNGDTNENVKTYFRGNTKLVDTDKANSTFFNFSTDKPSNNNYIYIAPTVTFEPEIKSEGSFADKYNESEAYKVVGIYDMYGAQTIRLYDDSINNRKVLESDLPQKPTEDEGYRLKSWGYLAEDGTHTSFDVKNDTLDQNMDLIPKYVKLYKVVIGGQTFKLEENQTLQNFFDTDTENGTNAQTALNNLKEEGNGTKQFKEYVNGDGEVVDVNTPINKDMEITAKFTVTVSFKGKTYTLDQGQNLTNLQSNEKEEIDSGKVVENKVFSHFIDDDGTEIDDDTAIEKNTNLTAKYNVLITIDDGVVITLAEGGKISEASAEDLEKINSVKNKPGKDFAHFDQEGAPVVESVTAFYVNTTLTPKYTVTVTVDNVEFTLDENQTLQQYIDAAKHDSNTLNEKLEKIKESSNGTKQFNCYVDETGTKIELNTPITKHTTITAKFDVTVTITISGHEYTIEQNQTLNDLEQTAKEELQKLEQVTEKEFSHYENEDGEKIDYTTQITKNTKLTPKYNVKVTINGEEYTIKEGQNLTNLDENGLAALTTLKDEENATKKFKELRDELGATITEEQALSKNLTLTAIFEVDVVIEGQKFTVEQGTKLSEIESAQSLLNELKGKSDKKFLKFVDDEENTVDENTEFLKHTNVSTKYEVTVTFKGEEFKLAEGDTLADLSSEDTEKLNGLKEEANRTFAYFEDEGHEKVTDETPITKNTTLTAVYGITVTFKDKTFGLKNDQTLGDLTVEEKAELEELKKEANKQFKEFVSKGTSDVISDETPITHNIELEAKYTVNVKISGTDYTIDENQTLNDLDGAGKEALNALKGTDGTKTFAYFKGNGTRIEEGTALSENTEITAVYEVTVTYGEKTFTLEEGQSLGEEKLNELNELAKLENKVFSYFVNEEGTTITSETTFSKNTTLTPKYNVKITIGGKDYTLEEGQNLTNLDEGGKEALNALKETDGTKQFAYFKGNGTKIEENAEITENTEITAVYNVTVTFNGDVYTLEEGQKLSNLSPEEKGKLDSAKEIEGKHFSHFVDQDDNKIEDETPINKNVTLTAKYNIKITISGEDYYIVDGESLENLNEDGKAKLNSLKETNGTKHFIYFKGNGVRIEENTPISENTEITAVYGVTVTYDGHSQEVEEGQSLGEERLGELEEFANVENKIFTQFVDEEGTNVTSDTTFTKDTTLTAKYNIKVTISGNEYIIEEGQNLTNLDGNGKSALEALKETDDTKSFGYFKGNGTKIDESTALSENTEITPVYMVTVTFKDEEFVLEEGQSLQNLDETNKGKLDGLKEEANRTFAYFENEEHEKVTDETPITKNTTLTAVYGVIVKFKDKEFGLKNNQTLDNLTDDEKAELEELKTEANKQFKEFVVKGTDETVTNDTPITHNIELEAKYTINVNINGVDYVLDEGKTLADLDGEAKNALEALKTSKAKEFAYFVDQDGNVVEDITKINTNMTITPKFYITVSCGDGTFTLIEGQSLSNLSAEEMSRLNSIILVDDKEFSHFENLDGEVIENTTTLDDDITLIAKYNVKITIDGEVFIIKEGESLESLSLEDKERFEKIKNPDDKTFLKFVDEEGNEVTESTTFNKNTALNVKYSIKVNIDGEEYILEQYQTLSDLDEDAKLALEELKALKDKEFAYFVDQNGNVLLDDTQIEKDITLTPKYYITVTINDEEFTLVEGQTLNDLSTEDRERLNSMIKPGDKEQFAGYINVETQEKLTDETVIEDDIKLEIAYEEKTVEDGPNTSDNILYFVLIGMIALAGTTFAINRIRKNKVYEK